LRRRLRGNGGLFAEAEFHAFASYQIDDNESASIRRPVILLAGTESAPFRRYICEWLAKHLNCEVASLPGGHMAYLDRPAESANVLRPIFRELAANTDSPTPRGSQTRPSEPEVSDGTSRYR
jgi:pimeloyl-ACP methyl ester carboxylesterase